MNPPAAFSVLIATAQSLVAAVSVRDNLHLRPAFARKSVAVRLVSGLRVLRAFLRRLIILIALDLEWGLVDMRGPMKRPHGRKATASSARFSLTCLDAEKASPWLNNCGPNFTSGGTQARLQPVSINMATLYAQLDFLAGIAANPMPKAKRLAFHLARTHQGIIMAPEGPKRLAGYWGTQVRASYDCLPTAIMNQSRIRPPPLPPPRTHWPTINVV